MSDDIETLEDVSSVREKLLKLAVIALPSTIPELIKAYLKEGIDPKPLMDCLSQELTKLSGGKNPREEVRWFATQMESKLRKRDYRGGWKDCPTEWLLERLEEETVELKKSLDQTSVVKWAPSQVVEEAVDVANFAMMITDLHRRMEGV